MVDVNETDPTTNHDSPEVSAHRKRVESFLARVTRWAASQSDIRGVILMGSVSQGRDDELSDVDLMLVATRPGLYRSSTEWLRAWGEPKLVCMVRAPASTQVVQQAVFDGPLVVDIAFVSNMQTIGVSLLSRMLERIPAAANLLSGRLRADAQVWMSMVARGTHILVDKGGAASRIQGRPLGMNPSRFTGTTLPFGRTSADEGIAGRPSRARFLEIVSSFWALSLLTSKHICRRELWMAHEMSGLQMRAVLLEMLEWHARSASGWAIDTWYEGRHMTEWADARALEALGQTFGHFDAPDTWRALGASMDLFRWLARETSDRLGYPYPVEAEEHVKGWIQARQEQWGGSQPGGATSRG